MVQALDLGGRIQGIREVVFTIEGAVVAAAGSLRIYNRIGDFQIVQVYLSVGTAPLGAALIVDVNKNGTTIFTTQSNRPQIAAGQNTGSSETIEVPVFDLGEYLTFDVDQVGSTEAGADLSVHIVLDPLG